MLPIGVLFGDDDTLLGSHRRHAPRRRRGHFVPTFMHTQRYAHNHNQKIVHDVALGFDGEGYATFLGSNMFTRAVRKVGRVTTNIAKAPFVAVGHVGGVIGRGTGHVAAVVGRGTGHGVMSLTRGTGHVVGNVGRGLGGFVSSNVRTIAPVIGQMAEAYMNKGAPSMDVGPAPDAVQPSDEKVKSSMLKNPFLLGGGGLLLLAGVAFIATRKRKK